MHLFPPRTSLHPVSTNKTAAQSSSFSALMVGVPTSCVLDPGRMPNSCPGSGEGAIPCRTFLGVKPTPPPVDFARYVKN